MKANLIVSSTPNPNEKEALEQYVSGAMPLLKAAGGEVVARLAVNAEIAGGSPYKTFLVMSFQDEDQLKELFASEAYGKLIPLREKAFTAIDIKIGAAMN